MSTSPARGGCEEAWRAGSDAFTSALVDSLEAGVAAYDDAGRLVLANPSLRALYQWPAEDADLDLLDRLIRESLTYPDGTGMPAVDRPMDRALRGESVERVEVRIAVPEGLPRHAEATAHPIRTPDGRTLGAVTAFRDITVRLRAERFRECELRVARALAGATSVADVASALVRAVASAMGWPHTQLWLVDEVADVMRLAAHWDAAGRSLDSITPPTVARGWGVGGIVWDTGEPMWIPDILRTDRVPTSDFPDRARRLAADGVRAVVCVPVRDGRAVLGVLTAIADHREDDGERVVLQLSSIANQVGHFLSRLRADELARELARTKEDFYTLVGQELRTPLASIVRMVEARATRDPGLREIGRDAAAVGAVLDDLLDLTALEGGSGGLAVRTVDLAALVSAVVEDLARTSGVMLHTGLPTHLLVQGDARRLRHVVDTVLGNAVQFTPTGGNVYVGLRDDPGVAELTVVDSGIGVPPDERRRVRRSAAGADAPERHIPDDAVGLSLTRAVVRAHGGEIDVTYGDHSGMTVVVRLPVGGPTGGAG
ncbi:ATP-binding protein [Cryptosporangium sp. NPDC051539]|uniref:ATP-binding protein n=1 Tax=Cryptosporangium sp. NPDC051539 TaxID=3363962 RepID=UPI00378A9424